MSAHSAAEKRQYTWPDWEHHALSPKQYAMLTDPNPRGIWNCGRGFGKTHLAILRTLLRAMALRQRRIREGFRRTGAFVSVYFVSPNATNQVGLWDLLLNFAMEMREAKIPVTILDNSKQKQIYIFGKSGQNIVIRLLSAFKPDSLRGGGADFLVMDEWAFVLAPKSKTEKQTSGKERGWEIFFSVLLKLSDRQRYAGEILILSTPYNNYFDDMAKAAMDGSGFFAKWSYHHATTFDAPGLTDQQIENIHATEAEDPYKYRQEILAELHVVRPKSQAGSTYAFKKKWLEDVWYTDHKEPQAPFYWAMDVGWGGADELTTIVADSTLRVIELQVHPKTDTQDILNLFEAAYKRWDAPTMAFDSTGDGKTLVHLLPEKYDITPVVFTSGGKPSLVKNLHTRIVHKGIKLPHPEDYNFGKIEPVPGQDFRANFQKQVKQLLDYRKYEETTARGEYRVRYSKGETEGDDCVDVLTVLNYILPPLQQTQQKSTEVSQVSQAISGTFF